jgi:hypothetical protein
VPPPGPPGRASGRGAHYRFQAVVGPLQFLKALRLPLLQPGEMAVERREGPGEGLHGLRELLHRPLHVSEGGRDIVLHERETLLQAGHDRFTERAFAEDAQGLFHDFTLTAVVIGGGGQGGELATEIFRQANVVLDRTFAGWHRRSPSTLAVMTDLAQQLKPCRPVPQSLVFPYQPGGEGQADLGAVLIPAAVNMVNLERSGGALAPRAPASQGRDDALARVHRMAVWSVCMRVKSASSHSSTGVKLTHGIAPGNAAGGTGLQPSSSRSARARDPSKALRHIERLSAIEKRYAGSG